MVTLLYYGIVLGILLWELLQDGDLYRGGLLAAALLLPWLPRVVYRLCGLRRIYVAEIGLQLFVLGSVICGSVLGFYRCVPHFDKVMHAIAGVLLTISGMAVYYGIKPNRRIETSDAPIVSVFAGMFTLSGAALWEIYEFFLSFFVHSDPQRVIPTGVGDTMWDILVCAVGGLLPAVRGYRYIRRARCGRQGLLMALFQNVYDVAIVSKGDGQSPSDKPS